MKYVASYIIMYMEYDVVYNISENSQSRDMYNIVLIIAEILLAGR